MHPQVALSHSIDFQVPMKQACTRELGLFCRGVPHEEARAIRCLQDNKYAKDFGKECRVEVGARVRACACIGLCMMDL